MSATRVFRQRDKSVLAVRRARIKVARGPDKGLGLELGGAASVVLGTDPDADLRLADDTVSQRHAELRATDRGWRLRDLGSTNGTFVGDLRIDEAYLDERARRISLGETDLDWKLLADEVEHALGQPRFSGLVGESPAMRTLFALLEQAAGADSTVLIEGESGTGKEVIAEALHRASPRAEQPFVVVDGGALARGVVESELFGHERGAFTGADRARAGAFEEADGGTLFLDEVGELSLELQTRLLRVLESREVKRIGAAKARPVDVRVIAATHRKLERMAKAGEFRPDLYYRLAVLRVHVPALRDRPEDILPLVRHFVQRFKPGLDPKAILGEGLEEAFQRHPWPGNVRELRNVIERLVVVGEVDTKLRGKAPAPRPYAEARQDAIEAFEREYVRQLLQHAGGVVARAADQAGISRQMFHRILKKHDVRGV